MRTIVLALACLTGAAAPARAEVIPLFTGDGGGPFPGTYQPNTPFVFELRAPGLNQFTNFNFDVVVETASPDPITLMSVEVFRPGNAEYAFGGAGTFDTSTPAVSPGSPSFSVNVNGSIGGGGVTTTAGANDVLARFRITPGPTLNEPVTFSVDAGTYTLVVSSESGVSYQPPDPQTIDAGAAPEQTPVPGPGGALLLGAGGVLVLARRRFARAG